MRRLGLLGGMSPESSREYYDAINAHVRERLGGVHSADLLLSSVDFGELAAMQEGGRWEEAGEMLARRAVELERAGAEVLVVCANTMHLVWPALEEAVPEMELLHIADPTAAAIGAAGLDRVALLGTRYTMEHPFLADRLRDRHGIDVLVPDEPDRTRVHDVVYDELVQGVVLDESRERFLDVIRRLAGRGAQGAILGCTEFGLLRLEPDSPVPLFDTMALHARAAADAALAP